MSNPDDDNVDRAFDFLKRGDLSELFVYLVPAAWQRWLLFVWVTLAGIGSGMLYKREHYLEMFLLVLSAFVLFVVVGWRYFMILFLHWQKQRSKNGAE